MVYHISDDAVIEKITLKQLLSSNINKESLAIYFASHILQCNTDSRKNYVVTSKGECKSNKLFGSNTLVAPKRRQTHARFYTPSMPQREEQHPSVSRAPTRTFWYWLYGSTRVSAKKHHWYLAQEPSAD